MNQGFPNLRQPRSARRLGMWSSLLTAALVWVGCSQSPAPPDENTNASQTTSAQAADSAIIRVSAEEWNEFVGQGAPPSLGWVALPAPSGKSEYQSSLNATALGLLNPEECAECHAGHVDGFQNTAHSTNGFGN